MRMIRKIGSAFLAAAIAVAVLAGCSGDTGKTFQRMEDFEQAKIAVMTGSAFDLLANEAFPESKIYYMSMADSILNLKQGKVDGALMDMAFFTPLKWENEALSYIAMDMPATQYAVALPKTAEGEELKAQLDAFIRAQTENGWLAEQKAKWFGASEPEGSLDLSRLTGEKGTLRVAAVVVDCKPFDYLKNEQYCGYDADFIVRFAEEYGYALEIDRITFDALLPSLAADRYDLALAGITVTEERRGSVLFSEVYYESPIVMAVLSDNVPADVMGKTCETPADFAQAKIGVITGSSHDGTVKQHFPGAERVYFNSMADMIIALEQGKIDCYVEDAPFVTALIWEDVNLKPLDEAVAQVENGFVFPQGKNENLREQINAFLNEAKTDGTIERLKQKWMSEAEPEEHPDYKALKGENGTIRLAIALDGKPLLYQREDSFTGFEMDLLTMFAQKYGYDFEFEVIPFESIIAGIATGKYEMGAATLNITPEREESVDFSVPYAAFDVVLVTKKDAGSAQSGGKTLADFEYATLGILSGSSFDPLTKERFPNAQRQYYTLVPDMILAVEQGKIDAYLSETTYVAAAIWEGAGIKAVDEVIDRTNAGFIFPKDSEHDAVRGQLNEFIRKATDSGLLAQLQSKWLGSKEPGEMFDSSSLTGENGTLKVAISPDLKPLSYVKDGTVVGYEVEVLQHFAKEYGYKLDFISMTFDAILPGIVTGKYDIGGGGMTITEERAQSVNFTDVYLTVDVVMVVKAEEDAAQTGFWDELREDFEKTFLREGRWKMIAQGSGVTMLISICAAVAGSLLGFGLYMLSRSDVRVLRMLAKGVAKVYSRIIAGTPVVVILMILFYVIFGKLQNMSGIVVASIGFTLTFGAFVYDHMTVAVNSVDRGQTEAAYALGYTKNQTFFRIIFPQAMGVFLPSYCGQAVELIKATAVVGYIAVNDLTKMGDIIRSNTYEAFFPLIATAVIYFLLTWLLASLLKLVKLRFEPKRRSKEEILKGVKSV